MAYKDHVDYDLVEAFRSGDMKQSSMATRHLPASHGIVVNPSGSWHLTSMPRISFRSVTEGPGHKPWLATWMHLKTGQPYYDVMIWDTGMAAINDLIVTGHMPITFTDDITAHSYAQFSDPVIRESYAKGFARLCAEHSMAITGGETASLPYLMNPHPPAVEAPNMSATVLGILDPADREIISGIDIGDVIMAVGSNGPQVNGTSSLIEYGLKLPDQFLTEVPGTGRTFGDLALEPTVSCARLVEELLWVEGMPIKGLLPATGDGLRKLFRMGNFRYVIENWPEVPPLFRYMLTLGMPLQEVLTTFNWGAALYLFVPAGQANNFKIVARRVGYELHELGYVAEGEPLVDFQPEKIGIPPRT